mgnify:CR=1 FL=1
MKTGNTDPRGTKLKRHTEASMEPGHEDREYHISAAPGHRHDTRPQWSPVMKTGNTKEKTMSIDMQIGPQWSPVMKTGNTTRAHGGSHPPSAPQWSPVMKTGNTRRNQRPCGVVLQASMEPGHEDREYF